MKRTISRHCRIICGCWLFINNFGFSFNGRFRYYHEFVYSFFISFYSYCIHRPNTPNVIVNYPDFRLLCVCVCFFALFSTCEHSSRERTLIFFFPSSVKKNYFNLSKADGLLVGNDKVNVHTGYTHTRIGSWMISEF